MMKTGIGGEVLRVIVLVAGQQLAQIVSVRMCIRVGGKIKRDTRGVVYTRHPTVMHFQYHQHANLKSKYYF